MNITVSTDSGRTPCGQNTRGASFLRRPVLVCCRPNHDGKVSPLPPRRVECKSWVWRALEDLAAARDTGVAAIVDAAIKDYVIAHGARPSNAPQTPCEREDGLPHNRQPTEARTRHGRLWTLLRRLWAFVRGDCGRVAPRRGTVGGSAPTPTGRGHAEKSRGECGV